MSKKRAFISFDFDYDEDLRNLFVGQAKNPNTPFDIADWSLQEAFTGNWIGKVRDRIRRTDLTIVICGRHTHRAKGVAIELEITREIGNPYFLLAGRADTHCTKPTAALPTDKIYRWSWENVSKLVDGAR